MGEEWDDRHYLRDTAILASPAPQTHVEVVVVAAIVVGSSLRLEIALLVVAEASGQCPWRYCPYFQAALQSLVL